jgi:hypothetical protein
MEDFFTRTCVIKEKNIENVTDQLTTAQGFQIAGTLTEVNIRERVGDWEADTIIGKNHKGAVITIDERKSKLRLAAPIPGKKAKYVKEAMTSLLSPVKQFVRTINFDNGKEFVLHKEISEEIECDTYFAKPYHIMLGSGDRTRTQTGNIFQRTWNYLMSLCSKLSVLWISQENVSTSKYLMKFLKN